MAGCTRTVPVPFPVRPALAGKRDRHRSGTTGASPAFRGSVPSARRAVLGSRTGHGRRSNGEVGQFGRLVDSASGAVRRDGSSPPGSARRSGTPGRCSGRSVGEQEDAEDPRLLGPTADHQGLARLDVQRDGEFAEDVLLLAVLDRELLLGEGSRCSGSGRWSVWCRRGGSPGRS